MLNFLRNLLIMIFTGAVAGVASWVVFRYLSKGLTGTGTGEIGGAFAMMAITLLTFIVVFVILGAVIFSVFL